jgi:undecaprenyl-diphosphatase
MIGIFQGLFLGFIQGLTEFFPVSSSGHLILFPRLLGWEDQGLAFDTVLHLGTLVALLVAYRTELIDLVRRAIDGKDAASRRQLMMRVLVAAIPGLAIGALFESAIETVLRGPYLVAFDLVFWGVILLIADRVAAKRKNSVTDIYHLSWGQVLLVGFSQAIALFPGTSRSGITMTAGLFGGLDRKTAVDFSFLLSIPTIAAAGGYGMLKIVRDPSVLGDGGIAPLFVGFLAAAIFGSWAIRFLRSYVSKHSLDIFVWYRFALAAVVLLVVR